MSQLAISILVERLKFGLHIFNFLASPTLIDYLEFYATIFSLSIITRKVIMNTNPHIQAAQETIASWKKNPELMPTISDIFESHLFVGPINPSPEQQQEFIRICKSLGLRALNLALNFEESGLNTVLQSSKYYKVSSPLLALEQMVQDAEKLNEHFEVVRIKLESLADNDGVPQTDAEACNIPGDTYFEYHLKLKDKDITAEDDEKLKSLSKKLCEELNIRVPFSCNNLPDHQRFLNARTYKLGFKNSYSLVEKVINAIKENGFTLDRIVSEFITYDTNKALDRGWLEFS
jgi:hypothetical protein